MASLLRLCRIFSLLLLVTSGATSALHRSRGDQAASFFSRRNVIPSAIPVSPHCAASCEIDVCGGKCSIIKGLTSRDLLGPGPFDEFFDNFASSNTSEGGSNQSLRKRFFLDGHWPNPYGTHWDITLKTLGTYMMRANHGEDDWYFNPPLTLVDGKTEKAFMRQQTFADDAFQFLTSNQNGCTIVTLVSQRAVWQAHFWEVYSHGREDTQTTNDPAFKQRVLDAIAGTAVPRPVNHKEQNPRIYIAPEGPAIDKNLFNQATDDTMLFLWTPTPVGEKTGERYLARNNEIVKQINNILGKKPSLARIPYVSVDINDPRQQSLLDRSHKGMVVFQYDPDTNEKGQKAWRAFFEDKVRMGLIK